MTIKLENIKFANQKNVTKKLSTLTQLNSNPIVERSDESPQVISESSKISF